MMMAWIDDFASELYQVLPADSHADIAKRHPMKVDVKTVSNALTKIRKDPPRYGFTIAHAVHYCTKDSEGKFYAVLCEKDGGVTISSASLKHLYAGNGELCRMTASSNRNNSKAFEFLAMNTKSRNVKRALLEFAKNLSRISEDADQLAIIMDEEKEQYSA
jgi:hypothetical protein